MAIESQVASMRNRRLPGELGLWIFILSDVMLFGLYLVLFTYDLSVDRESFYSSQIKLNQNIGLLNTLLLLTGSWAVVMGTRVENNPVRAANYLTGAAVTGVVFLALKTLEYSHLIGAGSYLTENRFFVWYFFLTGYHALHVLSGSIFLQYVAVSLRRQESPGETLLESAGCYWHLVDLLWIAIFTIAYLA
jgi:nitric oxide reductase NorE protein